MRRRDPTPPFGVPALSASGQPSVSGSGWTASGSDWASAIPALAAATTYTVKMTDTACNQKYTLGTFTTQ